MKKIILMSMLFSGSLMAQNKNVKAVAKVNTITLGGGCYWCVEAVYEKLDGVIKVKSGSRSG